jgi:hypothetical protein
MKSISTAIVKLEGVTPYSPSRNYAAEVPKLKDESHDAYDERTWRHHAHIDKKTKNIIIPGECFAWCIKAMSKRRSDRIPGKGQKTYTAAFDPIEVIGDIDTKCHFDEAAMESFMANSDGVRGSGKRVLRRFPLVSSWSGQLTFMMWDVRIPEAVFKETIEDAGLLIGIGRRRPENKGFFGRFQVQNIAWNERVDAAKILGI